VYGLVLTVCQTARQESESCSMHPLNCSHTLQKSEIFCRLEFSENVCVVWKFCSCWSSKIWMWMWMSM